MGGKMRDPGNEVGYARGYFGLIHEYMLYASWEVRMVKNRDRSLDNAARGRSSGETQDYVPIQLNTAPT